MSTFGGVMKEFPQIRVDYFRSVPGYGNPLACFLSHVHSDHLEGLENLQSPFVYCSHATREILLKLERYPHRINFAAGIIEVANRHYKKKAKILKAIPLETPTKIELSPSNEIQVTLFDANHCTGAVMFLFENDRHAVLYTGDIRSEPWFVNQISRSPLLVEYTSGIRSLDCIYLDTSFIEPSHKFPTKAQGLAELIQKVSKYPADTKFHFAAWTFGYEQVWLTLSKVLKTRIHVEDYKYKLYASLVRAVPTESGTVVSTTFAAPEAAALSGYIVGNTHFPGILTSDKNVKLHSCEKGTGCNVTTSERIVWIKPIIYRTAHGEEVGEAGIGGGGRDFTQRPQLHLSGSDVKLVREMLEYTAGGGQMDDLKLLLRTGQLSDDELNDTDHLAPVEDVKFKDLGLLFDRFAQSKNNSKLAIDKTNNMGHLPNIITFPFSRHSSYEELCDLVAAFKPKEVWPCTVEEIGWHEGQSMENLFGVHCSGKAFQHDIMMREKLKDKGGGEDSQREDRTPSPDHVPDTARFDEVAQSKRIHEAALPVPRLNKKEDKHTWRGSIVKTTVQADITAEKLEADDADQESDFSSASEEDIDELFTPSIHDKIWDELHPKLALEEQDSAQMKLQRTTSGHLGLFYKGNGNIQNATNATVSPKLLSTSTVIDLTGDSQSQSSPTSSRRRSASAEPEDSQQQIKRPCYESSGHAFDSSFPIRDPTPLPSVDDESLPSFEDGTFYDSQDDVYRCIMCGWEFDRLEGCCYNRQRCDARTKPVPTNDLAELEAREEGVEIFMSVLEEEYRDFAEAYESDSEEGPNEEYEVDSFIDDTPIVSDLSDDGEDQCSDSDVDDGGGERFKDKYLKLEKAHQELTKAHAIVVENFTEYRHDMDDFTSDDDDMDGFYDGIPYELVDVEIKDPPLTELVSSQIHEEASASPVTRQRLADRIAAFNAAADTETGWNRTLLSVDDNHTTAEVEL